MNMCVQIILCFFVNVLLYRICFDSRMGTSSLCHNKGMDDVNEAYAIPTYAMGCFKLPTGLCHEIEAMVKKFWRGQRGDRKKIH